jgi:hypothetical protein
MPLHSRLITFIFSSFLILGSAFGQMAAIEAEVTGVDGRSAKAAEVRIERQDKKMAQLVGKTDRRGRLTTTNLEVGTYKLTATVEGGIQLDRRDVGARSRKRDRAMPATDSSRSAAAFAALVSRP